MRAVVPLEEALENAPSTRALVSVLEAEAAQTTEETKRVGESVGKVLRASTMMCEALGELAAVLAGYKSEGMEARLATTIEDVGQGFALLGTQLTNCVLHPMAKLSASLEQLQEQHKPSYHCADLELWEALGRWASLGRKAAPQRLAEANEDVADHKKAFHAAAIAYFAGLNAVAGRRSRLLIEPVLGLVYALRAFASATADSLKGQGLTAFLAQAQEQIQGVHQEFQAEQAANQDVLDNLEGAEASEMYFAEPPSDIANPSPNISPTKLQMCGYLHLKKKALVGGSWVEAEYFSTAGRMLMHQGKDDMAGQVLLDVSEALVRQGGDESKPVGVVAAFAASEDRRNTFSVTLPPAQVDADGSPSKKSTKPRVWTFQARSGREASEWVAVLNRLARATDSGEIVQGMERLSSQPMGIVQRGEPLTPQSTPNLLADLGAMPSQPIQFDLVEEAADGASEDEGASDAFKYSLKSWTVRFMGSMEVHSDSGESLVRETIRQVMAARATHGLFAASDRKLCLDSESSGGRLWLEDVGESKTKRRGCDVAFWAAHPDDPHLFGFISRQRQNETSSRPSFTCHVLHADEAAQAVCQGFASATQKAFQALVSRRASQASLEKKADETADGPDSAETKTETKPDDTAESK